MTPHPPNGPRLERAHRAWRGDFLEGLTVAEAAFDDWVSVERQRLSGLRSDLLLRLARQYEADGDHAEAIAVARQLTIHDPLREEGHRLLISYSRRAGSVRWQPDITTLSPPFA